jgi:hypothetical protein
MKTQVRENNRERKHNAKQNFIYYHLRQQQKKLLYNKRISQVISMMNPFSESLILLELLLTILFPFSCLFLLLLLSVYIVRCVFAKEDYFTIALCIKLFIVVRQKNHYAR